MLQEFEDRVYDVAAGPITLTSGQYLAGQSIEIRNADADWFLTGVAWRAIESTSGIPGIRIQDATGRAIATAPSLVDEATADDIDAAPMGSMNYLPWPKNASLRFDLQELASQGDITFWILFRGFKRYRKGVAPCK
jgi:hypothetical protein